MKTKSAAIWILMCSAALGVGAVAAYVARTPPLHNEVPLDEPTFIPAPAKREFREPQAPAKTPQSVIVFVPTMGADGITFVRQEAPVPDGEDAKLVAINEFLRASEITTPGAKALRVEVQDYGLATVTLNSAFDQTYGTFDEKKMLDGLAAAMGQFPDVNQFTLYVGDKQLTTLGSADLTAPIQVIRPEAVPTKPIPTSLSPGEGTTKP